MKVLIGCEFSGLVREAFARKGHEAWSCDLLDSEIPGRHFKCDLLKLIEDSAYGCYPIDWDLLIAFPPCTYLCVSGARWFKSRMKEQSDALFFVKRLMDSPVRKICIENPIGVISTKIRKPDQILQPWQFGHGETKATCLWLKNLPKLIPTDIVEGREQRIHNMSPGRHRSIERSRTYPGIAEAMANQWG